MTLLAVLWFVGWLCCSVLAWIGGVIWGRNSERKRWLMAMSAQGGKYPKRRWP